MKQCKAKHIYFTPLDFTNKEINRQNKLARAIILGKHRICKACGFESKHKTRGFGLAS